MNKLISFAIFVTIGSACSLASAQAYQLSGKSYETSWTKGSWNGKLGFPDVFCAVMPQPADAQSMTQAMFNNNGIYLARIVYPETTLATVVTSTIPPGRSADEDIARLLASNREFQKRATSAGIRYDVTESRTDFGPAIGLTMTNITEGNKEGGPFPLARQFAIPKDGSLLSMSVHRLFARGPDRFEVAVLQLSSTPVAKPAEAEMEKKLAAMADAIVQSLQACTAQFPIRTPKP
jgi:hypothetical protein